MLKNFEVDLCFSRHKYEGELLSSKLVRQDSLALVVPEAHAIGKVTDISTDSLRDERFILSTRKPPSNPL